MTDGHLEDATGDLTANQKEFKLQVHIIEQHAIYFPHVIITAFPGRPGDAQDGFFKKMMGVRAGVSDIILWWSYPYPSWAKTWLAKMLSYCGFSFSLMHSGVVELKVDARINPAQNKFLSAIHSLKGNQGVVRSWQQYYKLLCSWHIKPAQECRIFNEPDYRGLSEKYKDAFNFFAPHKP